MDNFKAMGEKLKGDTAQKETAAVAKKEAGASELAAIKANPTMAAKYAAAANKGSENLAGQLPQLKIFTTGKGSDELADGKEPNNGNFFYTLDKTQFEELDIHILTVSKGFYALGLPDPKQGNKRFPKFNQIVAGVFTDGGEYKPFLMYFTGSKLSNLWEFGKDAKKFTSAGIPMFALTVKITTKKQTNDYGYSWIPEFEIISDGEGNPTLIHDEEEFDLLEGKVDSMSEMIAQIIMSKGVDKNIGGRSDEQEEVVSVINSDDYEVKDPGPAMPADNPDDLPFD